MQAICLDIETRASDALLADTEYLTAIYNAIEAPSNWKDPVKIQAHKSAALEKHNAQMALHWFTGEVVAIGWNDFEHDPYVIASENESAVLKDFAHALGHFEDAILCGFNIREFDIPYLSLRCAANKITLPAWWPTLDEVRWSKRIVDVRDANPRAKGKLDDYLRAMGLPMKSGDGSQVADMTMAEIVEYALADITVTSALVKRLAPHFRVLRDIF